MEKPKETAIVCKKCGSAVWIDRKTNKPFTCNFYRSHLEHFRLFCINCNNELDEKRQESGWFCSVNAQLLQWQIPSGDGENWNNYTATHLVCVRCKKEDRSIGYDWLEAAKNSWVPQWKEVNYYGITLWGKPGAGPWMEGLIFCQECNAKTDTENWLKQTMGLVVIREGHPSPHKISQLARIVEKDFPHIKLKPPPWG